jgi:flagellar basal-body rod protein FlgF
MDKALYIAMTGAMQNMVGQRANANNMANVNTTGFREDFAQARSMPVFGEHFPSRAFAMEERPGTNFQEGPLIQTGRKLDIAIKGQGWIAVQAKDGSEAYTRAGDLKVDAQGTLRTGTGLPVLGNGGVINLPPASSVEIGKDGTISIIPEGQNGTTVATVDRIKLVNPDPKQLTKGIDGLIHPTPESKQKTFPADGNVSVVSGFVEGSNVNAVSSLTEILNLSRQYELQVKVMKSADNNSQAASRLLRLNG